MPYGKDPAPELCAVSRSPSLRLTLAAERFSTSLICRRWYGLCGAEFVRAVTP